MKNPYNPRAPTDPRYYANRKELLSIFKDNVKAVIASKGVTKPTNIAVMGQWGTGKTSTLVKFRDIMQNEIKNARVFSSYVALKPSACVDADTFATMVLESIFTDYQTTIEIPEKITDFIRQELDILNRWKITKISVNPEIERKQEKVNAINFKNTLSRFWDKLTTNGFDLAVIMLDDIHYTLTMGKGEILYDLRTDMQALTIKGTRFMFVITGQLLLFPEMQNKAEPFTRLFKRFDLVPFNVEGTKEQIQKPLKVEGIDLKISEDVISRIHEVTGGHPYFVSLAMEYLLNKIPEGKIILSDFTTCYPDLMDYFTRNQFDNDFSKATDSEKEVLLKIAEIHKPEFSPKDVSDSESSRVLIERLTSKELIVKVGRGKYRLYTPLFAEYLSRKSKEDNNIDK